MGDDQIFSDFTTTGVSHEPSREILCRALLSVDRKDLPRWKGKQLKKLKC
jgi:hypothetical protein